MLNLREYLLINEAIKPVSWPYGSNSPEFNDKKFTTTKYFELTVFVVNKTMYAFAYDKEHHEVAFMTYSGKGDVLNPNSYDMGASNTNASNASKIFSIVLYILLDISNNWDSFSFTGYDSKLQKFYSAVTKNKAFVEMISSNGWEKVEASPNAKDIQFKRIKK